MKERKVWHGKNMGGGAYLFVCLHGVMPKAVPGEANHIKETTQNEQMRTHTCHTWRHTWKGVELNE